MVGGGGGVGGEKNKVAQNVLKHILVLECLKSDEIFFKVANFKGTSECEQSQWCKHAHKCASQ